MSHAVTVPMCDRDQFDVDVPRLNVVIDGLPYKGSSQKLWNLITQSFNTEETKIIVYFLTQTSLCDFYIEETKKNINGEHLVNGSGYIVYIDTKRKSLKVNKNFEKIYLDECGMGTPFDMDYVELTIEYDIVNYILSYCWTYEFEKNNDTVVIV